MMKHLQLHTHPSVMNFLQKINNHAVIVNVSRKKRRKIDLAKKSSLTDLYNVVWLPVYAQDQHGPTAIQIWAGKQ
jgi:uncharacterized protein YfkK (UPF0435 family)